MFREEWSTFEFRGFSYKRHGINFAQRLAHPVNVFPSLGCWIGVTLARRSENVHGLKVLTQCNKFILDVSEEYDA